MSEDQDPRELIRRYYPLEGAITPLVEIARVQPSVLEQVIALAMVLGIHAAEQQPKPISESSIKQIEEMMRRHT